MQITSKDLFDNTNKTSSLIAQALAKYHSLEMPLSKEPRWFFDSFSKHLSQIENSVNFESQDDKKKFEKFKDYNLNEEYKMLK